MITKNNLAKKGDIIKVDNFDNLNEDKEKRLVTIELLEDFKELIPNFYTAFCKRGNKLSCVTIDLDSMEDFGMEPEYGVGGNAEENYTLEEWKTASKKYKLDIK